MEIKLVIYSDSLIEPFYYYNMESSLYGYLMVHPLKEKMGRFWEENESNKKLFRKNNKPKK